MIMFFRKFLTFFVKFWDDPHKRNRENVLFFLGFLLICIASPNSDLRNALIKTQPTNPQKIDEKTTKNRQKLVQNSSTDFRIVFHQFWSTFLTISGPISKAFWTIWSSCGVSWPIFAPSHGFVSVHFGICGICVANLDQFWHLHAQPPT